MINLIIRHRCCGTPCFQQDINQEKYPCWGDIVCIDTEYIELDVGDDYEYRCGACEGHIDMYPDYDYNKYNSPRQINIE